MAREILTLKRKKPLEEKPEIKPTVKTEIKAKQEVKKVEVKPEIKPAEKKEFSKIDIEILRKKSFDSYPDGYKKRVKKLAAEQFQYFKNTTELDVKSLAQLDTLSRAFSEKIYFKFCSLGIMEYYERQAKES